MIKKDIDSLMKEIEIHQYSSLTKTNLRKSVIYLLTLSVLFLAAGIVNFVFSFLPIFFSFFFLFITIALSWREHFPSPSKWFLFLYPTYRKNVALLKKIKDTNKTKVNTQFIANLFSVLDDITPHIKDILLKNDVKTLKNNLINLSVKEDYDSIYTTLLAFYENILPEIDSHICDDLKKQLFLSELECFSKEKEMNSEPYQKIIKSL